MSEDKEYAGTIMLGVSTDTQDRDAGVIQQRPVPRWMKITSGPRSKSIRRFLPIAADGFCQKARRRAVV